MNRPSLKIEYDAFQSDLYLEDFRNIDTFKAEIAKDYSSIVKGRPTGRGGGAYHLIIDFFVNLKSSDYFNAIKDYLVVKAVDQMVDPLLDSYVLNPLKKAYKELKTSNPRLDCYSLTLEFLDTKIFIYSVAPDSIIDNKDKILLTLDKYFKNLVIEDEFPNEIHIPVYDEIIRNKNKTIYRPPFGIGETKGVGQNNPFFKIWGLRYQYKYKSLVYDVVNETFLDGCEFMTLAEYSYSFSHQP